jgi:hypothetical protein
MIPLSGKIRQPAGEIVSAFEDLLMVQYHCGVMSAGQSVVGSRRGHQYVGGGIDVLVKHYSIVA